METWMIVLALVLYFGILMLVSRFTAGKGSNADFFVGGRSSNWMLVSFGMIGASLSGVTFLSIPGEVGTKQFGYMQIVLGYLAGYMVVAFVLLPLYYRLNLTSIYGFLNQRFGMQAHRTGAVFFLVSRSLGSSIRLMLVASVLQFVLFGAWGVPFWATCLISLVLIWLYTYRGGIKTIVWTDTLQTLFMLVSLGLTIILIADDLDASPVTLVRQSGLDRIFFMDDWNAGGYFWKQFVGGMFITIGMTGLDQDMMQKNLSCRTLRDAQKNMVVFSVVLVFVNLLFLALGALLFQYLVATGNAVPEVGGAPRTDLLFADIAMNQGFAPVLGILFILGLIAAAYSSADSALTALTTSFSLDILNIEKKPENQQVRIRKWVHIGMTALTLVLMLVLNEFVELNAIGQIIFFAGFTYGPLIGLFFFGILTKRRIAPLAIVVICVLVPVVLGIWYAGSPAESRGMIGDYQVGAELIFFHGLIVFLLLGLASWFTPQRAAAAR
jgi:Na+/proline symporter